MPSQPSMDSETNPSSEPADIGQLVEQLPQPQFERTIESLEPCVGIEDDPDTIEDALAELDYELLADTAEQLTTALKSIHDPLIRSKSQFIDHLEVAEKNLSLVTTPMFERRDRDDALTLKQATRFALQSYTRTELMRQRAATQAAHRELTKIVASLDSHQPNPDAELESEPTLLRRIYDFLTWFTSTPGHTDSPSSSSNTPANTPDPHSTTKQTPLTQRDNTDTIEPLDANDSDIVWENRSDPDSTSDDSQTGESSPTDPAQND